MRTDYLSATALRALLVREAKIAGSQGELAAKLGVSAQYLSEVIRGQKEAGPAILVPLYLEREVRYRRTAR